MERIAHRGAKREFPENTLVSFQRAFDRGADAVELDVHATADGVLVVHHDPSAHGPDGAYLEIAKVRWKELQKVEFAPGIGIPALSDVLRQTPSGRAVYVEIKGSGIERLVAEVIRDFNSSRDSTGDSTRCAVHSFDHAAIERMRAIAPEIPRGILFEEPRFDVLAALRRTEARDVWPKWKLINAALMSEIRAAGGRVIAWTVNDAGVAAHLAALGVDGLCGDDVRIFGSL